MTIRYYEDEPVIEPERPAQLHDMGSMTFLKNPVGHIVGSLFSGDEHVQRIDVAVA